MPSVLNRIAGTCALLAGFAAAAGQQLTIKSETDTWRGWEGQGHAIYGGHVWSPMETLANFTVLDFEQSKPHLFVEPDLGSTAADIPDGTYMYIYTGNPERGSNVYLGHDEFPPYDGYKIIDEWQIVDGNLLPAGETESKWYVADEYWEGTKGLTWWIDPPTGTWIPVTVTFG